MRDEAGLLNVWALGCGRWSPEGLQADGPCHGSRTVGRIGDLEDELSEHH